MFSIYLNACNNLEFGIFRLGEWEYYQSYRQKKSSEWFHHELFSQLEKLNLKIMNCDKVIWCAGPGSYTGLRMVSGFVEALRWQGIKIAGFYAHKIPSMLGVSHGAWLSFAFKGDYYVYKWSDKEEDFFIENVKLASMIEQMRNNEKISFFIGPETLEVSELKFVPIEKFIKLNIEKISKALDENSSRATPIFYYRPPEKEFRISEVQ